MTPEQKLLYGKWSNYYNIRGYSNNGGTRYDLLQRQHDYTKIEFLDQSYTPDTTRTTATRAMLHGHLSTTVSCIASTTDIPLNFNLFKIHNHANTETDDSTKKSVKKLTSNHHSNAVLEPTDDAKTILTTGSVGEAVKEYKKVDRGSFCDHAKGIDCCIKNNTEFCDDIVVPEMMMTMVNPYSQARTGTDTTATTVCDESRNRCHFDGSTILKDDTTNDLRQFVMMRQHVQQVTAGTSDNISMHHPPKQIESPKLVAATQDTTREDVRAKSCTNPVVKVNCSSSNKTKKKKKIQCDEYNTKDLIQAVMMKHKKMLMDSQLADVILDTTIAPPTPKNNCDQKSSKYRDNVDRTPGVVAKAGNKKKVDTIRTGNNRSTEENEIAGTTLRFRSKQDERQVNTDNTKQPERRSNLRPIQRNPQKSQRYLEDESTHKYRTHSQSTYRAESNHKQRPSMVLPCPSISPHLHSSKKPILAITSPRNCSTPSVAFGDPRRTGIAPIALHPPYARFHHPHHLSTATNTVPTSTSFDYRGSFLHASQFGTVPVRREYQYGPSISRRGRSSIYPRRQFSSLAQPSSKLPPHGTAIPTNHSMNGLPAPAYDYRRKDFEPTLKRQHGRSVQHEFNLTNTAGTSCDKYTTSTNGKTPHTSTNGDEETDVKVLRRVNQTWKKRYLELLREEDNDDTVEVIVVDE